MTNKLTVQQQQRVAPFGQIDLRVKNEELETGLDFILSHFGDDNEKESSFLFPRKISTYKSHNRQFSVSNKHEIIKSFRDSIWLDCRINAYPYLTDYKGIQRHKPNFIFIDLDRNSPCFRTNRGFENAISNTLKNIREELNGFPTVLNTGGGYHIYQPVYCPTALENVTEFKNYDKPSQEFLRFAKDNLSNKRADKQNNPSFKSCLLRIPGSINSKYDTEVKIVQKWNGYRPPIPREFIEEFRTYLIQKKINEAKQRQKILYMRRNKIRNSNNSNYNIGYYYEWIDKKILANPFPDYRKLIINLILAPYLVVIKKLSYEESYQIINQWLQKCDLLGRKLDFNSRSVVNTALTITYKKQIPPMSIITLKNNYKDLYFLIEQKGGKKAEGGEK